jgi:hypothetical protein
VCAAMAGHSLDSEWAFARWPADGWAPGMANASRCDTNTLDGNNASAQIRRERQHAELDGNNASAQVRRERQHAEPIDDIDDGATHLGTSNDSAFAWRERQHAEPIDDIDDGATHLGTSKRQRFALASDHGSAW